VHSHDGVRHAGHVIGDEAHQHVRARGELVGELELVSRGEHVHAALWIVVDLLIGSAPVGHVVGDIASNAFALAGFATLGWTLLTSTDASWEQTSSDHSELAAQIAPAQA
jgi:hypothetical protein